VPVTFAWRDELERLTKQVVANAAMGNPPGRRSGVQTRQSSRRQSRNGRRQQNESILSGLDETMLLELLCRILSTDSIPAIQAWLSSAPDSGESNIYQTDGQADRQRDRQTIQLIKQISNMLYFQKKTL
jgi:hypothetical protein